MRDDPKTKTITGIVGEEPAGREGEYPSSAFVGQRPSGAHSAVTAIERREDYFGDHAIAWFDVYAGDRLVKSFGARYVAEVHYADEAAEQ